MVSYHLPIWHDIPVSAIKPLHSRWCMERNTGGAKEDGSNSPQELGRIKIDLLVVREGNEYIIHLLGGSNCVIHRLNNTVLKIGCTSTILILYSQGVVLFTAKPKEVVSFTRRVRRAFPSTWDISALQESVVDLALLGSWLETWS